MGLTQKQRAVIKKLGWGLETYQNSYYVHKYSSLGEDFGFDISKDYAAEDIKDYLMIYDSDKDNLIILG